MSVNSLLRPDSDLPPDKPDPGGAALDQPGPAAERDGGEEADAERPADEMWPQTGFGSFP